MEHTEYLAEMHKNLQEIQYHIGNSAQKFNGKRGRNFAENKNNITLLGVTKNVDISAMQQAFKLGITNFGESKVQEFLPKYDFFGENKEENKAKNAASKNAEESTEESTEESLPSVPNWHIIGHLQTNKAKFVVGKTQLIHSVDSLRLAKELDNRAKQLNITVNILLQLNIADEPTKYGISTKNLQETLKQLQDMPNISAQGIMCIAPYTEQPENNRKYFKKMYEIFIDVSEKSLYNVSMRFLSMGMSGDYAVAIEEGANIVRIGTKLFGHRGK